MHCQEEIPAIPLWIGGHAYLTVTPGFEIVRNRASGQALRRIPLCGAAEVERALEAARTALPGWAALPYVRRAAFLTALSDALAGYARHFSMLIGEESGKTIEAAGAEVAAVVEMLRHPSGQANLEVVLVCGNAAEPLASVLRLAIPALLSGCALVVNTPPEAPSALFALAELTARSAWPGGVFNLVHGGESVMPALQATGIPIQFA